jgi:ABC-type branched-subunit amino acid transport system substrate-binding protein
MKRHATVGLLLSVAALCAACSNSASGSSAGTTSGSSSSSSKTYDIWNFTDVPQDPAVVGVQAGINVLNAEGGVNGHKLVLKTCMDNQSANTAAACARTAAGDPNILASVGNFTEDGASVNPILVKADVAILAPDLDTTSDYTSPNIFAPDVGGAAIIGQQAIMLQVLHLQQAGYLGTEAPATTELAQTANQLLACNHAPALKTAYAAYGTPDFSPQVTSIGKVQILFFAIATTDITNAAKTVRQLGYTYPIMMGGLGAGESFTGVPNRGTVYRPGYFNTGSAGFQNYEKAMGSQAGTANDTSTSAQGYLGMMMVQYAAQKLGAGLSKQSIVSLFNKTTDFSYENMAPTANFTVKNTHLGGSRPNLVVPYVYAQQLGSDNKTFTTLNGGTPVNIFGTAAPSATC